ncbi:ABC transporter permease [Aquipuribacter sp. SD81]|uniref:ABC transporter permease n=1 Tax=Aquipuribacter sp. SD81 TaxID=3127703 RepID=UPI00301A745D
MRTTDLVRSAVANTFRSRLRTTLTVLALFVGAFTLTLTTALGAGVTDYVTRQVDSLGADDVLVVTAAAQDTSDGPAAYDPDTSTPTGGQAASPLPGAGAGGSLTEAALDELAQVDGLSDIEPVRSTAVDYVRPVDGGDDQRYQLSIAPTASIARADLAAGAQLDTDGDARQVLLPEEYVEPLGFADAEDAVGETVVLAVTDVLGEQHEVEAELVGVTNPSLLGGGGGASTALVDELAGLQAAGVDQRPLYAVATARFDASLDDDAVQAIKDDVAELDMSAQTVSDQLGLVTTVIAGITGVLNAFAVVALVAAAFGIVNTLLMSVQERTREIGLMKALGMSNGRVFGLFSLEAAFLGLLGSVLGVVVAVGVGTGLSSALAAGPLASLGGLDVLLFRPESLLGVVALIVGIAFVAGTLPARRAARQQPIDALRYE